MPRHAARAALIACAMAAASAPLRAETPEELDLLVNAGAAPARALTLAEAQAGRGELLEALSTLQRALFASPKAKKVRLMHAALLCRIDDHEGARAEFKRLDKGDYKKREWREARSLCGIGQED